MPCSFRHRFSVSPQAMNVASSGTMMMYSNPARLFIRSAE